VSRRVAAVAAVLALAVLVSGGVAGLAAADHMEDDGTTDGATAGDGEANETESASGGETGDPSEDGWTLEELRDGGTLISGASPSRRWLGNDEPGSAYLSYQESNVVKALTKVNQPEWAVDHVVGPSSTVDTDEVTLHINRGQEAPDRDVRVHIVTWEEKQVQERNHTVTKAVNVSESTVDVSLTQSFSTETIPLPNHPDQPVNAKVYIEEYPGLVWTFQIHTVATASELPFAANWPSFLGWLVTRFLLVVGLGGPAAIAIASKTQDRTRASPGKPLAWWFFVVALIGYFALYFAFGEVASWLVSTPWMLGILVVGGIYVAALTHMDDAETVLVERVLTADATDPLGNAIPDIVTEEGATFDATVEDGVLFFYRKGSIQQFLVRLAGAEPPGLDVSEWASHIEYSGDAPWSIKLYADEPDGDLADDREEKVIDIRWPSIEFSAAGLRDDDGEDWNRDALSSAFVGFAGFALIGQAALGGITLPLLIGLLPVAYKMAVLQDGSVEFVPAEAHLHPAKAARVAESQQHTVQRTFDALETKLADDDAEAIERGVNIAEAYVERAREEMDRVLGDEGSDPLTGSSAPDAVPGTDQGVSDD